MSIDTEYIEKLAKLVYQNDLSEISIEDEDRLITLKREKNVENVIQPVITAMPTTPSTTVTSQIVSAPKQTTAEKKETGRAITAPMVGTFYASPSPDEPPYVKEGDTVSKGQVVCIVEAMKLMNEIESEFSGKITKICVKNGDSVEIGQTLMYVE